MFHLQKRILIIQTAFIGDVVLSTALIEAIKDKWPDCELDFLLRKGNESLLHNHPYVNEILVLVKSPSKIYNIWKMLWRIRRKRYDIIINVQRFFVSGLLTVCGGAKETVGFNKNPWSRFFTYRKQHVISAHNDGMHEVTRNLALLNPWIRGAKALPALYPSEQDYNKIKRDKDYVCVAPTSVWFTKQWPEKKWVELIQLLPEHLEVHLLGGPNDEDACERILRKSARPEVFNRAGELSFLESSAFMKGAVMNYVNDSGPLHFASAVNAPVCAIFCSTVPNFGFGPLSKKRFIVESDVPLNCRPCGIHGRPDCPEGHFECAEISPLKVVDLTLTQYFSANRDF